MLQANETASEIPLGEIETEQGGIYRLLLQPSDDINDQSVSYTLFRIIMSMTLSRNLWER